MFKIQNNGNCIVLGKDFFRLEHWVFDHSKIISDFGIRISYFFTWVVLRRFAPGEPIRVRKAELR